MQLVDAAAAVIGFFIGIGRRKKKISQAASQQAQRRVAIIKHGQCVLGGWESAEYFELSIETGIVVHSDGQFPKADEIIHPHSGIKEAEER